MAEEKDKNRRPKGRQARRPKKSPPRRPPRSRQGAPQVEEPMTRHRPAPAPPPRLDRRTIKTKVVPALQAEVRATRTCWPSRGWRRSSSRWAWASRHRRRRRQGKVEQAEKELAVIAGQKPVRCKAKKSVANFKVREGMETGLKVTLRGTGCTSSWIG